MKRINQLLSAILVIALIIPTCLSTSFAVSVDDKQLIYRKVETSLSAIIPEKEYYGLEDVDMNNLSIGQQIPTYEVIARNLEPSAVTLYPIFDNTGTLVIIAAVATVDGEITVSISQTFVDTLCSLTSDAQISIIYDKNDAYLLSDGALTKLTEYSYEDHLNRDDIETLTENTLSNLSGTTLIANERLSVANLPKTLGVDDEEIYLSVPKISQPSGSLICWAACCASIVGYIKHVDYDAEWMAELYGSTKGEYCTDVVNFLNKYFTIGYTYANDNNYSNIWTSLYSNKPVYGAFNNTTPNSELGHALVIRGISYWSVFSAMDPLSGEYNTGNIIGSNNNKSFIYSKTPSGAIYKLASYGYGK